MEKLIVLHGALGSQTQLEPLKNLLSNDFEVISFNFSGHGGLPFENNFSIEQFAQELNQFYLNHNLTNASIFGYSMGGYVALYFAQLFPEKVSKIITLATKFYWTEAIAEKEISMLNPEIISAKIPQFAKQLELRHHPNDWKIVLNKTAKMMQEMGCENPLQSAEYMTINTPTLCIIGDKDSMVTIEETVDVYRTLPNGSLYIMPNTKHPIEQVDVTQLSDHIVKFLAS